MADQAELNLSPPPVPDVRRSVRRAGLSFAGLTGLQLILAGLALVSVILIPWGIKTVSDWAKPERIVSARLSSIVGEYVQAQARSASPPAQVEAEMRAFMATLDREIQRRSDTGQVVLVGEAVLTKNVPDITESLKKAVYASGIRMPRQASALDLQRLQQELRPAPAVPGPSPAPAAAPAAFDPTSSAFAPTSAPAVGAGLAPLSPAPTVSTFGGPNGGNNGQ